MYRFIHVSFAFHRAVKMRDLEPVFYALGDDWVRYAVNSWMVWTEKSPLHIMQVVKPFLDDKDQILVAPINLTDGAVGFLEPWIWNWINSKAPQVSFAFGQSAENIFKLHD
jgi:hypothetical protein